MGVGLLRHGWRICGDGDCVMPPAPCRHVGLPSRLGAERTYFFTANLLERRCCLLVERSDLLRDSFRVTKAARPFHLLAMWCCPTTCIACGRCLRLTATTPTAGCGSRPGGVGGINPPTHRKIIRAASTQRIGHPPLSASEDNPKPL